MTRENADQVIRCIKECWWRVGVLLVILLGFALIAMHGWPQGGWGLGWGAIGATASVVIGVFAIQVSYIQMEWLKEKRRFEKKRIVKKIEEIVFFLEVSVPHFNHAVHLSFEGKGFPEIVKKILEKNLESLDDCENGEGFHLLDGNLQEGIGVISSRVRNVIALCGPASMDPEKMYVKIIKQGLIELQSEVSSIKAALKR